jgi:hypothetical protein
MRFATRATTLTTIVCFVGLELANGSPSKCELTEENQGFVQEALQGWEQASRDFLELDRAPLPWIVLFDTSCVFHLAPDEDFNSGADLDPSSITFAGKPVPVRAEAHNGRVPLPSGDTVPVHGMAFASLYSDETAPFFVLALLDVWRSNPGAAARSDLRDIILGVVSHEIVHTRQLVAIGRRVAELRRRYDLPEDVDDDIVERRFGDVPGYREAYEAESDLFYAAVTEEDAKRKRDLIKRALSIASERRNRFFTGPDEVFQELEPLFLNMEGVAQWAAFQLAQGDGQGGAKSTGAFERQRNSWSQDESLAMFLLIDELVPDWRARVLGPELASPFALLREAIEQ